MSRSVIRARRIDSVTHPEPVTDPSILEAYLEDASGAAPGNAAGLLRVACEEEGAAFLRKTAGQEVRILPQAARSSLTGGAIPDGEVVVSVERMGKIGPVRPYPGGGRVDLEPGVVLRDLQSELGDFGYYYPPVPTYQEAMIAGTVSTNAGGPATFKYGVTRQWVRALRVLLFNGDLLEIERDQVVAPRGGHFRIRLSDDRELRVPVPGYRLPDLKKISAGYFAADPLDLVDLFIGSEGTLGLITGVTVDLVPRPGSVVTGLIMRGSGRAALDLSRTLREAARDARSSGDPRGPDVRSIEFMDGGSLDLLRRHGDARSLRIPIPDDARAALLFEMEIPEPVSNDAAQDVLAGLLEEGPDPPDGPLTRLYRILAEHDALDHLEFAFPEDESRSDALKEFREAVPKRVNELLAARRRADSRVKKVGGDLIVPPEHLDEMVRFYENGFRRRGLSFAIWGHVSDGNLHPNAVPRDAEQVKLGYEALLEFAEEAKRRGGCPLSEHGVGRSPVKHEMLRRFVGDGGIESMRGVKAALDPEWRFAPGVLFRPASLPPARPV